MQSFDEYAALTRHLHQLQRSGERTTERAAAQRDATGTAIDQLGQQLTMQGQRLTELAQLIGEPAPQLTAPAPLPPLSVTGHLGSPAGPTGPAQQGGVTGQEAYPELAPGPDRVALTATPAAAPSVPGQRLPTTGEDGPAAQQHLASAVPVNPDAELDLAYRAAAAADQTIAQVESLAQQPAFLPTASPFGRALAVYAIFIVAGNIGQAFLSSLANLGVVGTFTLYAWALAGLPALAFFAGYFALGRWGSPRMLRSRPERYARLGFALCFVSMAVTSCFWTSQFGV
ncbi:hypothetical protein ACI2K4_17590 [Micromonospora sp. NPDC050397]|uniref:hypothetical protein n=1 Tax=Micromonospora sp. NPDC050397 TaxID=3364279 RepID=UPI00384D40C3